MIVRVNLVLNSGLIVHMDDHTQPIYKVLQQFKPQVFNM